MCRVCLWRNPMLWILILVLLAGCAPAPTSPSPMDTVAPIVQASTHTPQPTATDTLMPTVTDTPMPTQTPTPPPATEPPPPTATTQPTLTPSPVAPGPGTYEGWQTYTNTRFGFSLRYPADWTLQEDTNPVSTLVGRALFLRPPGEVPIQLVVAFRRADEDVQITRTGIGSGDLVERGAVIFLGEPIARQVLVCEGKDLAVLYAGAGQVYRDDLVFAMGIDYLGSCADKSALPGDVIVASDLIVASFALE